MKDRSKTSRHDMSTFMSTFMSVQFTCKPQARATSGRTRYVHMMQMMQMMQMMYTYYYYYDADAADDVQVQQLLLSRIFIKSEFRHLAWLK